MALQIPPANAGLLTLADKLPGVVVASQATYGIGWASNATGKDDTAALNLALTAARATTTGVGTLILDAATYFISGPLDCHNVRLIGQGAGSTRITLKSDWASALPCNAQYALDQMPSGALGAPTQGAITQAAGSSAYTLNQVVSAWVTASNSRNGGETPVSGMQQITIAANGRAPTFNWTAITRFNAPIDLNGGPWKNNTVMGGDPSGIHPGVTTYACGIAAQVEAGGDYEASNLIARLRTDGKPWSTATASGGDSIVRYNGALCRLYRAAGAVSQGDLVMISGGAQAQVVKSTGTAKVIGVALLAASTGQSVLVAQSGIVSVNSSANTIAAGSPVIADGTNNGAVVAGTLSSPNILGASILANSGGLTTVGLQGLL